MNQSVRTAILMGLAALLFSGFGFWLGTAYGVRLAHAHPTPHELLHHSLDLTVDQNQRLASLEAQYTARVEPLRMKMDAADHDLANALSTEHGYGPRTEAALSRYYRVAQELRKTEILHAFAMRSLLDSDQLRKFDLAFRNAWAATPP